MYCNCPGSIGVTQLPCIYTTISLYDYVRDNIIDIGTKTWYPCTELYSPSSAPVTLLEYGDYQCPYCGQAYPIIRQVQRHLGSKLCFVFRNFPITQIHPHAQHAAEAAESAAAQNKFWEMHDHLYENQQALDDNHLEKYASKLGLDLVKFNHDMSSHAQAQRIREDFLSGVRSGVNYINGIRYNGYWDLETLLKTLRSKFN